MALFKCPQCGKNISDQATQCPHCGVAIASTSSQGVAEITMLWNGVWVVKDNNVNVTFNKYDKKTFSFKNEYKDSVSVDEGQVKVDIECTRLIDDHFSFIAQRGKKYNLLLEYSRFYGGFRYTVTDEDGDVLHKKDFAEWRKALAIVSIPIYIAMLIYVVYYYLLS